MFSLNANFTRFTDQHLQVTNIIHKAFLEVSEKGTEAAAATILAIQESGGISAKVFHCDRPFMFLIMDNNTKNLIFTGAYLGPTM
ncbi:hypothetical protein Pcinc_030697 [Petrolisthes cinctipes]|uniref:Serpin domain-containing protein n=1 Tax=Petrolisthes cinctipes TaxID=88211 RepID=A0AAE1EXW6_PETCI|nr:hypothetical protein Pcinc_030697 [Petrolisthes cinctipes]